MKKFFSHLRKLWQEAVKRRRYASKIDPVRIGNMAKDLAQLVQMALCQGRISQDEAQYLQQLQKEMERLIALTEKTAFRNLPADRRVTLFYSLKRSHEKLITSIQGSDAPTTRVQ